MSFYLAATRFNNLTYQENKSYREKYGEICVYGSSFKIREIYPVGCLIFVTEMNNETNKIEGIGLIRNTLVVNGKNRIYGQFEYNRFIYKGNYWLSREQLIELDIDIVETLENILFKGKSHFKRHKGITVLTPITFTNWDYELEPLKEQIRNAFLKKYTKCNDISNDNPIQETVDTNFELVDEYIEVVSSENN